MSGLREDLIRPINKSGVISGCSDRNQTKTSFFRAIQKQTIEKRQFLEINQQHTNHIVLNINGKNPDLSEPADAIISDQQDAIVVVRTADCLPILIYHRSQVVAAVHAGRRGTDAEIFKKVLLKMTEIVGANDGFTIWLGPRICEQCYEIDPHLNINYSLIKYNLEQYFQVIDASQSQIIDSKLCTSCDNHLFYSYRKNEKTKERIYSCIGLGMV